MKYVHTNIVAEDWRTLADFYETVFECKRLLPERDLKGEILSRGVGVENAELQGMHLRLPGYGEGGPTLEIFSYSRELPKPGPAANRLGYGHLAFSVENIQAVYDKVIAAGGKALGELVGTDVEGAGRLEFVYMADPEGNIIELQSWHS